MSGRSASRSASACFLTTAAVAMFMGLAMLALFSPPQWQVAASCALIGLCVGSFANVVIWRLPIMLERHWESPSTPDASAVEPFAGVPAHFNLAYPPSACPGCHARIRSWENVPVLSYVWLRGRCASCKGRISVRYPIIEALFGMVYGVIGWHFGIGFALFAYAAFFSVLVILFAIDADTQLLPDVLTQPLLWMGLLANTMGLHTSLESAVWGAAGGYMVFWLIATGFKWVTGKDGMGGGDTKLLAALGAWLGWAALPWIMLIAAGLSASYITLAVLSKRSCWAAPHAFGPHLALAGGMIAVLDVLGASLPGALQL